MEHEEGHVEEEAAPEDSADVDEATNETAKTRGNNVDVNIDFNVDVKEQKTPVQTGLTARDQSLADALASASAALDTDDTSESSTNTTEVAHDHSHLHIMLND